MSWKLFIVIAVIIVCYIYSYYRFPKNTYIMQSHIRMFKPELLLTKQPIVIDDNTIDLVSFKSKLFSYNPCQQFTLTNSDIWYKNKYKYIILQCKNDPVDILLCNPNNVDSKTNTPFISENESENAEIVEIQLSVGQVLIIPYYWLYFIQNSSVECFGIHDYITYFLP